MGIAKEMRNFCINIEAWYADYNCNYQANFTRYASWYKAEIQVEKKKYIENITFLAMKFSQYDKAHNKANAVMVKDASFGPDH